MAASIQKGDPIFVTGRLNVRTWERDDRSGTTLDVTADVVGHDLSRGTSDFKRTTKAGPQEFGITAA